MAGRVGASEAIYRDGSYARGTPASEIQVGLYHQVLLCPVALAEEARVITEELAASPWQVYAPTDDGSDAYAEIRRAEENYFHPFVRPLLQAGESSPLRRLQRHDIRWADITCHTLSDDKQWTTSRYRLRVRRLELYLFEVRAGVLVVEFDNRLGPHADAELLGLDTVAAAPFDVARGDTARWPAIEAKDGPAPRSLFLQDILWLQDQVRRLYAPYTEAEAATGAIRPGHCLHSLSWLDATGTTIEPSGPATSSQADSGPAIFRHWQQLLEPLTLATSFSDESKSRLGTLLGDERMGVMTYIAVRDRGDAAAQYGPRQIGDADWMRLATQEPPGNSAVFPYAPSFFDVSGEAADAVRAFNTAYAYDRHYDRRGGHPGDPEQTTRYLISGMGFVAVTRFAFQPIPGTYKRTPGFGIDPVRGLLAHFRYHYFKIGLIAHLQRATLLTIENELADLAKNKSLTSDTLDPNYDKQVARLSSNLVRFRANCWFSELTGQIQGQEIFDRWSAQLRTPALFDRVTRELAEAHEHLRRRHEAYLTYGAWRAAWVAAYLAVLVLLAPFVIEASGKIELGRQLLATVLVALAGAVFAKSSSTDDLTVFPRRGWQAWVFWSLWLLAFLLFPWTTFFAPSTGHSVHGAPIATATLHSTSTLQPTSSPTLKATVPASPTATATVGLVATTSPTMPVASSPATASQRGTP